MKKYASNNFNHVQNMLLESNYPINIWTKVIT